MQLNRFWSAIWTVVGFLFSIALLQYIADNVVTLFGLLPALAGGRVTFWVMGIAAAILPIAGALAYINWRWSWGPEHIGLRWTATAPVWLLGGLAVGGALAYGIVQVEQFFPSTTPNLPVVVGEPALIFALQALALEVVYRGVLISRLEYDLARKEFLLSAILLPLVWVPVQTFFQFTQPSTGVVALGTAALSVTLSLLFMRTESVWLTAGLRAGLYLAVWALGLPLSERGLMLVFGPLALVLFLMEWLKVKPISRPGTRRTQQRTFGKTVRGPWGPH